MKKMNILVTGSNGQLGSEIRELSEKYPSYRFHFTAKGNLDISNKQAVKEFVELNEISTIINCAAYTAVDRAESEQQLANKINHIAVKHLAEIAKELGISLIHVSTDYIFDGQGYKPYTTDHTPNPVNLYGKTKLDGENSIRKIDPARSLIIRTSWVYSTYGNNFVKTMLRMGDERERLKVVADQVGSPTYAKDLARFILNYTLDLKNERVKTFHFTNDGVCSWYDFAKEIMALGNRDCRIEPINTSAYPTPARRPYYSVLDKENLKSEFNFQTNYWKESLQQFFSDFELKVKSTQNVVEN